MIVQSPNGLRIRADPEFCALLAIAWHRHPSIEYAPKSGYERLPWPMDIPWRSMRPGGMGGGAAG